MSGHLLVLARHGQSVGNLENRFTGLLDLKLTDQGRSEAGLAGMALKAEGLSVRHAFTSALARAKDSCTIMLEAARLHDVSVTASPALNERDYGDLTGLNKDEARQRYGEATIRAWRRSYGEMPPGGESLRATTARVLPFFLRSVLPAAMSGGALVVAHGNSLRALVMALDGLTPEQVEGLEIATSEIITYRLSADAAVASRRSVRSTP